MLFLLSLHRGRYQTPQIVLGASGPQGIPQRDFRVAKEAHLQVSIGRDAQPVAAAAKVLRHGRDEANLAAEARHSVRLRGIVRPIFQRFKVRVTFANGPEGVPERNHRAGVPPIPAKWHVLYEPHVYVTLFGHRDKVTNFVIVEPYG